MLKSEQVSEFESSSTATGTAPVKANAVYLFGPEDGSVPYSVRGLGQRRVFIPTRHCINLAAAIYVLPYDRLVKQYQGRSVASLPIGEV